jgi:hypothetical protein
MNFLRLFPVIISFLLLAAHFYRAGNALLAGVSIAMPFLLFLRESWVPRLMQIALLLGSAEWLLSLYRLAGQRIEWGQPWARLALILGVVALFTALAGLVFRSKALRRRYARVTEQEPDGSA